MNQSRGSFTQHPLLNTLSVCLYIVFVVSVSAGLLFVNALLCLTIFAAVPKPFGEPLTSQLGQIFFFGAPILLLLVQWNLLDRLQRLFDRHG